MFYSNFQMEFSIIQTEGFQNLIFKELLHLAFAVLK